MSKTDLVQLLLASKSHFLSVKKVFFFSRSLSFTHGSCDFFQAEMERALLQGERQAELDQMEAETDIISQLQQKLDELESAIQREKDKVRDWGNGGRTQLSSSILLKTRLKLFSSIFHSWNDIFQVEAV